MNSFYQSSLNSDPLLSFSFLSNVEFSLEDLPDLALKKHSTEQENLESLQFKSLVDLLPTPINPFPSPEMDPKNQLHNKLKDDRFWIIETVDKDKSDNRYHCPICVKTFTRKYNLKSHYASTHILIKAYTCPYCHKSFARKYDLKRHVGNLHSSKSASSN